MTNAQWHLGHKVMLVLHNQPKQRLLLIVAHHVENRPQTIAQREKSKVWSSGPNVANQVPASIAQPFLKPMGNRFRLNIKFVLDAIAVLFRRASANHLDGFTRHPIMLEKMSSEVVGVAQAVVRRVRTGVGIVAQELGGAAEGTVEQYLDFQGCAPDIQGAIDHKGTIGDIQGRRFAKSRTQNQI